MSLRALLLTLVISITCCISTAFACHRERVPRGVSFEGIARATHISSSGMNLYVKLDNTMGRRLVITRGEVDIMLGGSIKVTISLRDKVTIAKGYNDELLLPLRFKSVSTPTIVSVLRRIASNEQQNVTISYRVRGGTQLLRKTFKEENIAISEIFNNFAISELTISDLIEFLR